MVVCLSYRHRVALVLVLVPEKYLQAEDLLREAGVASTVVLMDTGLETALLVTGRTNAIDVAIEVTLRGIATTVPRSSSTHPTFFHTSNYTFLLFFFSVFFCFIIQAGPKLLEITC